MDGKNNISFLCEGIKKKALLQALANGFFP